MIFIVVEVAVIAALAAHLHHRSAEARRRNAQSWDSIVLRLSPEWNSRALANDSNWKQGQNATPEEKWQRIHGANGLCAMYRNTSVMLELADYATRNSVTLDRELLANLRRDALQIRMRVAMALVQYAFSQLNEGICANAMRAASMYAGMTEQMAQLLQVNAGEMLPACVAAM
jgi:hypothetical protein